MMLTGQQCVEIQEFFIKMNVKPGQSGLTAVDLSVYKLPPRYQEEEVFL